MRICREYQKYYNDNRPHQGINGKILAITVNEIPKNIIKFDRKKYLGGKIASLEPIKSLAV